MGLLDWIGRRAPSIALLVDGPNVFRAEFDVDLDDLRLFARERGRLAVSRVYLDTNASEGLIQAAEARGFECIVTSSDVDVRLAVDATELACERTVDLLMIASRDADFKPAVEAARRRGLRTVAVAPGEHGRSGALTNAVDEAVVLSDEVTPDS